MKAAETFAYNLRFPGQYFMAETGLNQNWNRDYDPAVGRYTESDPLGLTSGVDTYVYALNMPTMNDDQKGLEAVSYLLHNRPKPPPVPCGCTARLADFLQFQIDLYVISVAGSYTKYGDVFAGGGMNRGYPNPASIGVSITDG